MPDTEKFAARVQLGKKVYEAGEDVPIGGAKGLDPAEAARIAEQFGRPAVAQPSESDRMKVLRAENSALKQANAAAETEKAELQKQIDALTAENADLKAKSAPAEPENDASAENQGESGASGTETGQAGA